MRKMKFFIFIFTLFFLFACQKSGGRLKIIGTWGGSELETFKKVCGAAGVEIDFETTRDLDAILTTRLKANNLPDMAILPNPSKMKELIKAGTLRELNYIDRNELEKNYSKLWIDMGSYGGKLFGIYIKAANKSLIWYNPEEFKKNGWLVPSNWDELISLTKKIASSGKKPWSIGADIGWPLSDWIENILVHNSGPEIYNRWIYHEIRWTHSEIKKAFLKWYDIVGNKDFLCGGIDGTLSTKFQNAAFMVFTKPPKAYLHYEGDFISSIVVAELSNIKPGESIDFFPFPPIKTEYGTPGWRCRCGCCIQ